MSSQTQDERNVEIREKMLDLKQVNFAPVPSNSQWMKSLRMNYVQNKSLMSWDMIKSHDGIAIIVFNTSRKKLIFVRQFRPVYYAAALPEDSSEVDVTKYPATLGLTLELCAGMVDKNKSIVEIAVDELKEECGYEVPASAFEKINCYRSSVASACASQTLFYVEVTDEMKKYKGMIGLIAYCAPSSESSCFPTSASICTKTEKALSHKLHTLLCVTPVQRKRYNDVSDLKVATREGFWGRSIIYFEEIN